MNENLQPSIVGPLVAKAMFSPSAQVEMSRGWVAPGGGGPGSIV